MKYFISTIFLILLYINSGMGQDAVQLSIKDFGAGEDWVDTFPKLLFQENKDCVNNEFKYCFFSTYELRKEAYSYEQQNKDYKSIQADTLELHTRIEKLIKVFSFDCTNEMGKYAKQELDVLTENIFSKFLGKWNWEWTGSNWGTGATPAMINEKRTINFTPNEIVFTYPDTIMTYPIEVFCLTIEHCGAPTLHIKFKDNQKKFHRLQNNWMISIDYNINCNLLIRGVEKKDEKDFLYFKEMGVVCGATEKCYSRPKTKTK